MEKIFYWLKKTINFNWKYCRSFCPTCEYYETCKSDNVLGD